MRSPDRSGAGFARSTARRDHTKRRTEWNADCTPSIDKYASRHIMQNPMEIKRALELELEELHPSARCLLNDVHTRVDHIRGAM